jgi:hypothetical protein
VSYALNLKGKRFGRLVAKRLTKFQMGVSRSRVWRCRCDCGRAPFWRLAAR